MKLRIEEGARRAGDAAELVADSAKLRKVLGWQPEDEDLGVICSSAYRWEARLRRTQAQASRDSSLDKAGVR